MATRKDKLAVAQVPESSSSRSESSEDELLLELGSVLLTSASVESYQILNVGIANYESYIQNFLEFIPVQEVVIR